MNKVTATPNVTELTAAKPQKTKLASGDGEFKEMLSGELKTKGQSGTPSAKTDKTARAETTDTNTKPVKGQSKPAKASQSKGDDDTSAGADAINANAAAVAAAQNIAEPGQDIEDTGAVEIQELLKIQPTQLKMIQLQPVEEQPVSATQTLQTPAIETAAQAEGETPAVTQIQTAQAQVQPETAHPVQAEAEQVQTAQPEQSSQQAQAVQANAENPVAQQTQTAADKITADAVSDETTGQTAETQAVRAHPNTRHEVQADPGQTRFDEMLARAAQELGQGKTAVTEKLADTLEAPIYPAETVAETILPDDAEPLAGIETEADAEVPAESTQVLHTENQDKPEVKQESRTSVIRNETAPRIEQRPLKEIPKSDEAVLGMIQPKPHETFTPEVTRSEPEIFANPVVIPEQAEQIRAQVIQSLEDKKMEFTMQLNPQELGKIDVKMVLESGKLSVEIVAASQKSTELLTKQAEALIASLKTGNIDISSVNIVQANQNASANMDSQYNLNNFQNHAGTREQSGSGNKSGNGHGGDAETTDAQANEASGTPQRLLNYSV